MLVVAGEIDVASAPTLKAAIAEAVDGSRLVIDLTQVTFIDSSGLSLIVGTVKRLGQGNVRVAASQRIQDLFRLTGLHSVVPMFASGAEALGTKSDGADRANSSA